MNRRWFTASMFGALMTGCDRSESTSMADAPPEKVHLIPDIWHIQHVGRVDDGRLFWIDAQLDYANGITQDFVCTFVFDPDGHLVDHSIELIGERGTYPNGSVDIAMQKHLAALGSHSVTDIWVRPFNPERHGAVFGLVPRQTPGGEWRVEFMPGNTLSFYPPWEAGEYDT